MIRIGQSFASLVVEGISEDPIGGSVGDGVAFPFDVIAELALVSSMVVFGIEDSLNQIFGLSIDDQRRWRRLVAIGKGIGGFGFQLRDMENRVNANRGRKTKRKRHS